MITREITPAYAMLDHSDAEQVMGLLPSEKIMYLPRNQIDRAWSHLRYRFDQGEDSGFSLTSNAQIKSFIDNQKLTLRSDYIGTLQRCKSVVPENQFSIGFYDDIKTEPAVFLKEPGSFLEIDLFTMISNNSPQYLAATQYNGEMMLDKFSMVSNSRKPPLLHYALPTLPQVIKIVIPPPEFK